ncbi:MAG: 50S ribosomal protein L4 [Verrucomicrobiales bacterium]
MAATVLTLAAAKKADFNVIEDDRGGAAVHELITAYRANRRSGTANTKTRGEVKASNAKPWRQKGTGRARAGRTSSPIWRGGGVVFGPKPRDYSKKVLKGVRRLAFSKALSERIADEDVLVVPSFAVADGKTRTFVKTVDEIALAPRVLVVANQFDEMTFRAARNVAATLLMTAAEVNVEHILYFDKIVVTEDAIEVLAKRSTH